MPTLSITNIASKVRSGVTCSHIFAGAPFRTKITRSGTAGNDAIDVALFATDGVTMLCSPARLYFPYQVADIFADLSPFAAPLMSVDRPDFSETDNAGYFTSDYANVRIGYKLYDAGSYTVDAQVYTLCLGTVQLGEDVVYGQNAAKYLPTLDFMGLWLTRLSSPKVWYKDGYVYAPLLAHLVSQSLVDGQDANPDGRIAVRQRFDGGAWQYQFYEAAGLGVAISTLFDDGTGTAFYNEVSGSSLAEVEVWWVSDYEAVTLEVQLLPTLSMPIQEACNNPMWLTWKNSKGGFDVWCFEGDRPTATEGKTISSYSVELGDLATQRATTRTFNMEGTQSVKATAVGLTLNEVRALTEILTSPSVLAWNNGVWIYVEASGANSYNERDRSHSFEMNVKLLELITQNG